MAEKELKRRKASKFVRLELPHIDTVKSWIVTKNGIPYRCCYQWGLWPLPGGWKARVDVGYEA